MDRLGARRSVKLLVRNLNRFLGLFLSAAGGGYEGEDEKDGQPSIIPPKNLVQPFQGPPGREPGPTGGTSKTKPSRVETVLSDLKIIRLGCIHSNQKSVGAATIRDDLDGYEVGTVVKDRQRSLCPSLQGAAAMRQAYRILFPADFSMERWY